MKLVPLLSAALLVAAAATAQNPIIQTKYTCDPAPYVHNDTVYLLTDHDNGVRDGYDMTEWLLYTSTDMVNWTDHGPIASLADYGRWANTADNGAWASQLIERNGKWYMYNAIQLRGVGVLRADSPYGPWRDTKKQALFNFSINDIDPTVYIDDDGQAYIYWGNSRVWYAKLREGMTAIYPKRETPVPLTVETMGGYRVRDAEGNILKTAAGADSIIGTDCFEEAPWVYKRGGKYYLIYAGGPVPEHLSYAMADSITGPWQYKGRIMAEAYNSFTTHPGIIEYKGHNYLFSHNGRLKNSLLKDGNGFHRSVFVQEFEYNADGTIPFLTETTDGVTEPVGHLDALQRQEAETINLTNGVTTRKDSADIVTASNGVYVASIDNNDYIRVRSIDFGQEGATAVTVCAKTDQNEGSIVVSVDGTDVATVTIPANVADWTEFSADLSEKITGIHDVQFKFKAAGKTAATRKNLFLFDYWQFKTNGTSGITTATQARSHHPQGVYALDGRFVSSTTNGLPRGLYIVNGRKVAVTH